MVPYMFLWWWRNFKTNVCVYIYIYNPQVLSQKVTQEITMSFSILNYFNSFGIL